MTICNPREYVINQQQKTLLGIFGVVLIIFGIIDFGIFCVVSDVREPILFFGFVVPISSFIGGCACFVPEKGLSILIAKICSMIAGFCAVIVLCGTGMLLNYCYVYDYYLQDRKWCTYISGTFAFNFLLCIVSMGLTLTLFCRITEKKQLRLIETSVNRI